MTPIPSCESARLEALYRYVILGTESDSAFDDLARLASSLCRTPIAVISFVDAERQWFKSSVGLDYKEARREGAFCAHTIAGTDVFMVEHADADERFKNHPWVVEQPALRFYAGVPLMTPDGYAIGSLAVMDVAPRTLSPEQLACLRTIANQVMAQLELRRTARRDNRHKPDRWEERVIEQKQVEEIFREDEHKFRAIFEQAPVGIATIDSLTGRFLSVNASLCAIVGYTNEEMLSRTFLDITHPDDLQADLDQMKRLLDGETATFEMGKRQFRKNGDTIWVHLTCVSLWQRPSDPRMHVAIVQDITERKRAEERAQQFQNELEQLVESRTADLQRTHRLLQSVIDSSPDWIFVKDREHRFVLVNKAFAASQQRTPADMADRLDTDFWPQELCEGNVAKGIRGFHADDRRAFAGELIRNPYDPASLHDGTLRIFDTYKGPWHDSSGQIAGVLCYARDVTDQRRAEESVRQLNSELAIRVDKRTAELAQANRMLEADIAERKRAEEERAKQELLISLMLSTGPGCIKRVAADGTVLHMNPAGLTMIEACQEEEAIGLSVFDLILPEHRTAFINMHQDVLNGASRILQFEIQGLKGGRRWMETHAVPFRNPGTGSIEHLAVTHDITERKQAEEALQISQENLRQALQASNTGLWDWNTETSEVSFSKEWKRQLGYEETEIEDVFESWETRLHPDDHARSVEYVQGYLAQPAGDYYQEFRLRHKDGTYRWIEARASFVTESDGRKVRLLGSHIDITERKQAALMLADKTNELSDFIEHATVNMHWVGPDGIILWANQTELDFLGYASEEYIGHHIAEFHVDQPAIQDILTRLTCAEIISEYPARIRSKDGSIKDVLIDSSVLWKDGEFSRTSCFTRDISLRKKAEAFAEGQRIVLNLIATNAPLADILSCLCVEMEKQHDGMLCSVLLLEGMTLRHAAGPSLPDEYNRAIDGVRIGPSVGSFGTAAYKNDTVIVGDIAVDPLWADYKDLALRYELKACWSMPIRDATGAVLGTFATYYRVPAIPSHAHVELIKMAAYLGGIAIERHSAEEALRSSEERFRLVAETTLDILWDRDCGTNKMWWSPNARVKFGGDPSGDVWVARLHPDDRDRILALVQDALSSQAPRYSAEYRFRLEDGSYGHFLDRASIIRDGSGKPTRMIGAMIDVTAAKQAYASLQEAYHRLQVMANKLQTVESDERRRLSRELHDEVGQLLTALKFDLESLRREKAGKKKMTQVQLAERLARSLDTTDLLFTRLRQIVRSLRPPVLETLGLKAALESLAADVKARTGLACSVLIEGADRLPGLTPTGETALYRIAQELLTNVMRHAQAKTVSLSLSLDSDHWFLTVEDDGIGFDLTALPETGGVGLHGIRERAEIFGGHLHLTSQQGHGTLAVVWLPAVVDRPPRAVRQPARTPSARRSARKRAHD